MSPNSMPNFHDNRRCENISATKPCVAADTWVHTLQGPRQVRELVGINFYAVVNGQPHASGSSGFFPSAVKSIYRLHTVEGFYIRLTADHKVRRVTGFDASRIQSEWCEARDLNFGDRLVLNDQQAKTQWQGPHDFDEGLLVGTLLADSDQAYVEMSHIDEIESHESNREVFDTPAMAVAELTRAQEKLTFKYQLDLAHKLGVHKGEPLITRQMEKTSSEFYRGFLRGFYDVKGRLESNAITGGFVTIIHPDKTTLQSLQRMLLRLGIVSYIDSGRGQEQIGQFPYQYTKADQAYELIISGYDLRQFSMQVGFSSTETMLQLMRAIERDQLLEEADRFTTRVEALNEEAKEAVFDVQIHDINTFDGNGFIVHNCGE